MLVFLSHQGLFATLTMLLPMSLRSEACERKEGLAFEMQTVASQRLALVVVSKAYSPINKITRLQWFSEIMLCKDCVSYAKFLEKSFHLAALGGVISCQEQQ